MNKDKSKWVDNTYRIAALANAAVYNSEFTKKYANGAPHIKHLSLRKLYAKLAIQVYDYANKFTDSPKVLDLGAGEGSTTLQFLELGAQVTAVDSSKSQLASLKNKCGSFKNRLEVYSQDVEKFLNSNNNTSYDIVVVGSFLHHIPDYLGLIRKIIAPLPPHGQFFSFQDPLWYDSVGKLTKAFSDFSYFSWRIFQGDVIEGIKRRMRRARGIYLDHCESDNAEYHVARNGIDQNAVAALFQKERFYYEIIPYFSTQSSVFQPLGSFLGLTNTFAVIARR